MNTQFPTNVEPVSSAFRAPPQNIDAEKALLGAIMMNNRAYEKVSDFLLPLHFSDPANAKLYESIIRLLEQGHQANPVTLKTYLERDETIIAAGGMQYIAALAGSVVTIINAADYGKLIYDLHLRRQLIALGDNMVNDAFDVLPEESAMNQIENAEQQLFDLASEGTTEGGFQSFDRALVTALNLAEAAHRREGALAGVTTGLVDLDRKLGGLHKSDLLILAGRPSMGKTALATTMAFNAARYYASTDSAEDRGKAVAFFSLEMSSEQLATRILSERARLSSHEIRTGKLSNDDFARLVGASQELNDLPLYIDDTPAVTVSAIRTRCRRLARAARKGANADPSRSNLGMIVIDYLQLIAPSRTERSENRVQEISSITRGLKALAKELNVPVLALSQLSRAVEQREDKRPQLADLRESGTIEQDSDVVMFVYREQYYLERAGEPARRPEEKQEHYDTRFAQWQEACERAHNVAEVIVAKQRHGPIGMVKLHFEPNFTHFSDHIDAGMLPDPME
ncbi:MAG: replicative DNA helicase [Rhodospirillaceae bacterium]|nr:replicative DNA helicase [Rhodospirillaceae bacterium]